MSLALYLHLREPLYYGAGMALLVSSSSGLSSSPLPCHSVSPRGSRASLGDGVGPQDQLLGPPHSHLHIPLLLCN